MYYSVLVPLSVTEGDGGVFLRCSPPAVSLPPHPEGTVREAGGAEECSELHLSAHSWSTGLDILKGQYLEDDEAMTVGCC